MPAGALTGPCSLCGSKSSCNWRPLPECTGERTGDPACNACFVSVWKQNRDDPGNMDAMLAARAALRTAPRTKRRRRGMKLLRCRSRKSTSTDRKRRRSGSPPGQPAQGSGEGTSRGTATDGTDSKSGGSSSTWEDEEADAHAEVDMRQQQGSEQRQMQPGQSPPQHKQQQEQKQHQEQPPPPRQQRQQQEQQPAVALAHQMMRQRQDQHPPASPQHYVLSPLHVMPLPPPPPLPQVQQQQRQQPAALPPAATQQHLPLSLHAAAQPPPAPLPQLLPQVLLPLQPQLLPLPQPLSTVVAAPPQAWAAQLGGVPGLSRVLPALAPGFHAAPEPPLMQQVLVDVRGSSKEAASRAWLAACELPGAQAQLLGLLPAMWVQATCGPVHLAGVLLVHVLLPPPGLRFEAQQALLMTGQQLQLELRLVVYCFQTGRLLYCRERLGQEECLLQPHPRLNMQAWDSGEGWQLVFPEMGARKEQVTLFANLVLRFGRPLRPDQIPGGHGATAAVAAAPQQAPQQQPPAPVPVVYQQQREPAAAAAAAHLPSTGHWADALLDAMADDPLLAELAREVGISDDDDHHLCSMLGQQSGAGGQQGRPH